MTQQSGAPAGLAEELGSVSSTHAMAHNHPDPGEPVPSDF